MANILIANHRSFFQSMVLNGLRHAGHAVTTVEKVDLIESQIRELQPDMVLLDRLSEYFDGFDLMMSLKREFTELPVLVYLVNNHDDVDELKQLVVHVLQGNFVHKLTG